LSVLRTEEIECDVDWSPARLSWCRSDWTLHRQKEFIVAITTIAIVVAFALAFIAVTPFALPAKAHVARSAVIAAPAQDVYAILSTASGFDRINPFRDADPSLAVTFSGPDAGVGASFAWSGKSGSGRQTIVAAEPGSRLAMQLDLGPMGRPMQSFTLEPVAEGTRVTWAIDAELGPNPVKRVFGIFMDRMLGQTYEAGLKNLARVAVGT
jgi:uncharacterized protein YndB with AHSA1/START domain